MYSTFTSPNKTEKKKLAKITIADAQVRCCCDDKIGPNNHKSLLSRLRNLTDRLSISFDSKEAPVPKPSKYPIPKTLNKSVSINTTGSVVGTTSGGPSQRPSNNVVICKKCNLSKLNNNKEPRSADPTSTTTTAMTIGGSFSGSSAVEKRSMTLPKARRSQDCKNKSWRTVFAKEKRPSVSLETLPASGSTSEAESKHHRRNLSNPEGKTSIESSSSKGHTPEQQQQQQPPISFKEIDVRHTSKPEILVDPVNPGSSSAVEDIGNYRHS